MKPLAFALFLSLSGFLAACEECAFCQPESVTLENGIEVLRTEGSAVEYCDELLEELRAFPTDTVITFQDASRTVMVITTHSCL